MGTPRPTVWSPPKTPRPTKGEKTPKPTMGGGWGPAQPSSTDPCPVASCIQPCRDQCGAHEECVTKPTWFDDDKRCPACDEFVGCVAVRPSPLQGCAVGLTKNGCKGMEGCAWKEGYPPLEFSEDSDYVLLDADDEDESFFAVDGSVVEMVSNLDYRVLIGFGLLVAAVVLYALRSYIMKKEKMVITSEATALLA